MNTETYSGHVVQGAIVLDDGTALPEGTRVRIEVDAPAIPQSTEPDDESLSNSLLRFAGTVRGLPADMAEHHDHYIHGCPKQ